MCALRRSIISTWAEASGFSPKSHKRAGDHHITARMHRSATMTIYAVPIKLLDMPYLITSQLEVPATIRLDHLHAVFQRAMGWHNTHL
jgi:hypothetical protein